MSDPTELHSPLRSFATGLRAWAELTRISNLPTVISNVIVWAFIAGNVQPGGEAAAHSGLHFVVSLAAALGAICAIYLAGMVLNDACDVEIDRRERPGRPIPSGRVSRGAAFRAACSGLIGGPLLLLACNPTAALLGAALALCVVAYNRVHARWAGSMLLMGACRALIYPTVVAAFDVDGRTMQAAAIMGCLLGIYTLLFSLIARGEAGSPTPRWPALVIPCLLIPLTTIAPFVRPEGAIPWIWVVVACGLYILWTGRAVYFVFRHAPRIVPAVLTWLAGICLFDVWIASWSGNPWAVAGPLACFAVTVWGHRRVLGT